MRGFVPSFAKSVEHELRNGINLCDTHHSDFDGYRFFIRWVPSVSLDSEMMAFFSYNQQIRIFVFVNFSRNEDLEQFHGKSVVLDANHQRSPFPAPFLIQEMCTRGFHPWRSDRPIPLHDLPLILLATIMGATWQIWEVEVILGSVWVGLAAWADRMEVVER